MVRYFRRLPNHALQPTKINTLPVQVGPFPPGTPLTFVFSRDPTTGEVLCDDIVENRGHHYGAELPDEDKEALVFWLRQQ